jgi:hypothetical protein
MMRKFNLTVVIAGAMLWAADIALAAPKDYMFEPVTAQLKQGDDVVVAVRLIHKKTRKPVSNAEVILKRIDMSPDAMGEMTSPLTALPSPEPGVYAFKTDLSMAGRWLLSIAAMVPGERQAVVGKITFRAAR